MTDTMDLEKTHEVVIIGGGFGGLNVARRLRNARNVRVTVIDRRNHHLFQPLLYQVATGGLSPADISSPIRFLLKRQRNARVLLAEATGINAAGRRVLLTDGDVPYDTLVVATGASHSYFGRDEWARVAPGLKTLDDATAMRRRILLAFEAAERSTTEEERRSWLTFVVVGGGPTGVELAGAIGELTRHTLNRTFRSIDTRSASVYLLEASDRLLPAYRPRLSARAEPALRSLGVTVRTGTRVVEITPEGVAVVAGEGRSEIRARTVLWTAGVAGSPLGASLASATGVVPTRNGKVPVQPDFTLAKHPEIFVIGDLASYALPGGGALRGTADVAIAEGKYVGEEIKRRIKGRRSKRFSFLDRGTLAVIGRSRAVVDVFGRFGLTGPIAWWIWLFLHLLYLVGFQNRLVVLVQWGWNFTTRNRSALLITGPVTSPLSAEERQE